MTEDFDTISTVIHKTAEKRIVDIGAFRSILSQCKLLNPSVFLECRRHITPEWVHTHQPCSNHAFIRMIENGFVSDNRVHDAFQVLFTQTDTFTNGRTIYGKFRLNFLRIGQSPRKYGNMNVWLLC
jgi:hypothetical protein